MFNANDSSMNSTSNSYVPYSATKNDLALAQCNAIQKGNVISYNLRIIQEYFEPKIRRNIRIFSLGRKNNVL